METFSFAGTGGLPITGYRWDPDGEPRAIVQLTHGMGEHALRYAQFAEFLTGHGYVVYADDQRGHGATASPDALGDLDWPALVADIGVLGALARDEHPGRPLALIAHSMGSFAAQQFVLDSSDLITALVLTGTAALDQLEPMIDLEAEVDLSAFNAPFAPARTDFDWLTRDDAIVDAYIADPLCGFGLTSAASKQMFAGARRLADPEAVAAVRGDLPIHIVGGALDPVGGGGALVALVAQRFTDAGVADVSTVLYPDARHEILNETNRAEVDAEIAAWLDRVL